MKNFIFILLVVGNISQASLLNYQDVFARNIKLEGGAVGSGGGTIVCRNADHSIRSVEVLDLFEARVLRQIPTDLQSFQGSWKEKVAGLIKRLGGLSQMREQLYGAWLNSFEVESLILKDIEFSKIPDAMYIGVPTGCAFEQAAIQIMPRFPGDRRYYLNAELWDAMDDTQKAALVFHEIVYREALSYGHSDSIATRYLIALFTSSNFKKLTEDSLNQNLMMAHFEQTDVALPYSEVEIDFDTYNLWHSTFLLNSRVSNNSQLSPITIHLKGRMIVNLGVCKDLGCADWRKIYWDSATEGGDPQYENCSGIKMLSISGDQIAVPEILYPAVGGKDQKCEKFIKVSLGGEFPLQISYLKESLNEATSFPELAFAGRENHDEISLIGYERKNGKFYRSLISAESYFTDHFSANVYPEINHSCHLDISFDESKTPVQLVKRGNGSYKCSEKVVIDNTNFYVHADFTGSTYINLNEGFYSGGGRLESIVNKNVYLGIAGELTVTEFLDHLPRQVSSDETIYFMYQIFEHVTSSCAVEGKKLDLYENFTPKQITLTQKCEFKNSVGEIQAYKIGSMLKLNEDASVKEAFEP